MSMRGVLITGASGFIGRHVVRLCAARGWSAWAWTRDVARTRARLGAQAQVVVETRGNSGRRAHRRHRESRRRAGDRSALDASAGVSLLIDSRVKTTDAGSSGAARRASRPRVHGQCQRHRLLRSGAGRMARRILAAAAADVSVAAVHCARSSGECREAPRHARGESAHRPGPGRRRRHPAASRACPQSSEWRR